MEALHDVVKAGKARYIGASSMYAWQFAKAQHTAERHGWTKFVTMQNHYNLVYREEEREMLPLCVDQGVGVIPWSPLARGFPHPRRRRRAAPAARPTSSARRCTARRTSRSSREVAAIAAERGVSRAPGRLWRGWRSIRRSRHPSSAPPSRQHIDDALASLDITLTDEEIRRLEAPYTPQPVQGFA